MHCHQAEEDARKEAEARRKEAEAEAEAERAKVAESKAKADAELEEQRQREMQALQTEATDLAGPQVCRASCKHPPATCICLQVARGCCWPCVCYRSYLNLASVCTNLQSDDCVHLMAALQVCRTPGDLTAAAATRWRRWALSARRKTMTTMMILMRIWRMLTRRRARHEQQLPQAPLLWL